MISWCLDKIEKLVTPKKTQELEMKYVTVDTRSLTAATPTVTTGTYMTGQTAAANVYPTATTNLSWGHQQIGTAGNSPLWVTNPPYPYVPAASGSYTAIKVCDALGTAHVILVDDNFIPLMDQISQAHTDHVKSSQVKPCLPDPDFSLDDLGVAEKMIEEMNVTQGQ